MHLGLIMDGNGRWATRRHLPRTKGHEAGVEAAVRVVTAAAELGIDYLTLYAFSTENWKRPESEVQFLMNLFELRFAKASEFFLSKNIKFLVAGDIDNLPEGVRTSLTETIIATQTCTGMKVIAAINYGGHNEITRAVNKYISENPGKPITEKDIENNLDNPGVPAPDLIARSAGEKRLSNFLLWNSAYSELLFIDKYWPDWGKEDVAFCVEALSKRERKFGGLKK